ncbi:MAG: hypothetical protein DRP56_00290 [Planctomycetota bacterium]|nr:MAG: hypothetical protein DRP56_00290 [Planctomycetota bacterium]
MTQDAPYKTLRAGKMSIALWQNEITQQGRTFTQHSARIQKRYRDKQTGEWKTTEYLYRQDLADLIVCAQKAFETVSLTETNNGQQTFSPEESQ